MRENSVRFQRRGKNEERQDGERKSGGREDRWV